MSRGASRGLEVVANDEKEEKRGDVETAIGDKSTSRASGGDQDCPTKKLMQEDEKSGSNGEAVTAIPSASPTFGSGFTEVVLGSWLNVLALGLPVALASKGLGWPDMWTFSASLVTLVPLAERISFVTEDVAKYTNDTTGGVLSATFGNITEVVVSVFALRAGLLRVVQVSMLGSVLSNLLLVLGSALFVGGTKFVEQKYNAVAQATNSALLIVAVLAMSLPTILDYTHNGDAGTDGTHAALWLSRFIAILMLVLYGCYIFFQLKTHTHLYEGGEGDDDEPGVLGLRGGIFWLGIMTFCISFLSNFLVDAIEGAAMASGVPILFLSGILIPLVGNATEHSAALIFAWHDKMDIALGSAVGSSVQISFFVIPSCVLVAWGLGQPMTLNFHLFETLVYFLTCVASSFVLMDGSSHWLKGIVLMFAYFMIAAAFWAHSDPSDMKH